MTEAAMTEPPQLQIVENGAPASKLSLAGPLELGRQQAGEPGPWAVLPARGAALARLVIARHNEADNLSRRHALLEPLPAGAAGQSQCILETRPAARV